MADPRGPFRPTVKLDRSQVADRRLNTPVETRAAWNGKQRAGQPPYMFPISPLRRVNPSIRPEKGMGLRRFTRKPVIRGGAPVPAGALTAAFTVGRTLLGRLRGSPITGPTKLAHLSRATAGPISAARLSKPRATPRPRSGGSARAM